MSIQINAPSATAARTTRTAPLTDVAISLVSAAAPMAATIQMKKYAVGLAEPAAISGTIACRPQAAAGQATKNAALIAVTTPKRRYAALPMKQPAT